MNFGPDRSDSCLVLLEQESKKAKNDEISGNG